MNAWFLEHPHALWALLVVPWLWWRARAATRAEPRWTGSLALWRRAVPAAQASPGTTRRGSPWALLAGLLAIVLAVVALAEPTRRSARPSGPTVLVLDRSPSMYLPVARASAAPLRIERAVALALEACDRWGLAPQSREWRSYDHGGARSSGGARPPPEWLDPRAASEAEIPWARLDAPEVLWISDCEPAFEPRAAGVVRTGAMPIPGPIADLGATCLAWDGERAAEQPWGNPRRGLALEPGLPGDLERLARIWAEARGLPVVPGDAAAVLRIGRDAANPQAGELDGLLVIGDGSIPARAVPPEPTPEWSGWGEFVTDAGARLPAVAWRPGEIRTGIVHLDAARADPAAFALAWALLFDQVALPQPGVVALAERSRSGPERTREPAGARAPAPGRPSRAAAWLALGAAAACLSALALARANALGSRNPGGEAVRSGLGTGSRAH